MTAARGRTQHDERDEEVPPAPREYVPPLAERDIPELPEEDLPDVREDDVVEQPSAPPLPPVDAGSTADGVDPDV